MQNVEKTKKTRNIKWLFLPVIAAIFVVSAVVYVFLPASMKPVNDINDCIDAGYMNKVLNTGEWQCTTPDGRIFTE